MFMFAICRRRSVCLSVVCNVRAPYSGDWNFRQCFYAIWYLGHLWPFGKNFTEIVPGKPFRRGLNQRGVEKCSDLDLSKAISRKRCKIGGKLLLITTRKSHMIFRLVPKSVILNDLERRNGHCQVTRTEMNQDTWLSIRIDIFSPTFFCRPRPIQQKQHCVVVDSVDKFS